jgi:hypothetical protein
LLRPEQHPAAALFVPGGAAIDIHYRITGYDGFIQPGHPLWQNPLPSMNRAARLSASADGAASKAITHAEYFEAVRSYLTDAGRTHIQKALAAHFPPYAALFKPDHMDVVLEKHGEFYHPARIDILIYERSISLALNVAVTPAGRDCMTSEVAALGRVAQRLPPGNVPTVYGHAEVPGPNNLTMPMFLADWFSGFHEFHLSINPRDGRQGVVVWDTQNEPFYLSDQQQVDVYRQVAFLLTRAYDPDTTRQIYPWHHAAGDFVMRVSGAAVGLRLISVRQYAPTLAVDGNGMNDEARLMALLVFFLNLTLRNRIDRLDGTGDMVWAGSRAVAATVRGAIEALPMAIKRPFDEFLNSYAVSELMEVLRMVADRYILMPMEKDVIRAHLASHGEQLIAALQAVRHDP